MFFEYGRLLGFSAEGILNWEFIFSALLVALFGLTLVLVGFNIKGVWGALMSLLIGTFLFLCYNGLL